MNRKGTNQYQRKYKYPLGLRAIDWIRILIVMVLMLGGSWVAYMTQPAVISPLGSQVYAFSEPVASPTPVDTRWPNVIKMITDEFEPEGPEVVYQAITIAKHESGGKWKWNAYNWNSNATSDMCVFQINDVHIKRFGNKYQTDIKECIRVAHVLYKEQGWEPWVAAHNLGFVN